MVKNESEKLIDNLLIAEMKNLGINFTEINLKFVAKNNDGLIMFLEKGNSSAGFQHILEGKWVGNPRFQLLFNNSEDEMIKNIAVSIKNSSYKEKIIDNKNRLSYIYLIKTTQGYKEFKIATGSNGFIVSFIPNW